MSTDREEAPSSWRQRAEIWSKLGPPARPSPGDVAAYEAAVRAEAARRQRLSCLILGTTPELRSIAHGLGCTVACADTDRSMFEMLTPMVSPRGAEELLCVDWFDLPADARFDVVLGDGSLNMIPSARHAALIGVLARAVRAGGALILRVHLRTAPPFATFEEILFWYRREHRDRPFYATIRTPLYMLWMAQHQGDSVDAPAVYEYLRGLHAAGVLTDEEFGSRIHKGIRLYLPTAAELEALVSGAFSIEAVRHGGDYGFPENHAIYVLRRRGRDERGP